MTAPLAVQWRPSPNWNARRGPGIRAVVLHYTGMPSGDEAEARLRDPRSEVSAHYLLHEDGRIVQMVAERHRAWHAGRSWWRGDDDLNSSSIGIEIVNPGHEWGYRPFPPAQIARLLLLLGDIVARHAIRPDWVLGHSDVAPGRKMDPGELFPWTLLQAHGLALAQPPVLDSDPGWDDAAFIGALGDFGYDVTDAPAAVLAFQRHFRQARVDGGIDGESRAILRTLLRLRA